NQNIGPVDVIFPNKVVLNARYSQKIDIEIFSNVAGVYEAKIEANSLQMIHIFHIPIKSEICNIEKEFINLSNVIGQKKIHRIHLDCPSVVLYKNLGKNPEIITKVIDLNANRSAIKLHENESEAKGSKDTRYGASSHRIQSSLNKNYSDILIEKTGIESFDNGSDGRVFMDISWEPSSMNKMNASITLNVVDICTKEFILEGECNFPLPKGPLQIKKGHPIQVSFKNNKLFTLNKSSESLKPKRSSIITIGLDSNITYSDEKDVLIIENDTFKEIYY
ncbi:MAG: hypothetical protein MHPSP_004235, partial [Paramarteilia canceri]